MREYNIGDVVFSNYHLGNVVILDIKNDDFILFSIKEKKFIRAWKAYDSEGSLVWLNGSYFDTLDELLFDLRVEEGLSQFD